jgi:hypothetical protein
MEGKGGKGDGSIIPEYVMRTFPFKSKKNHKSLKGTKERRALCLS